MKQKFHATNRITASYERVPSINRDSNSGDYLSAPVGYEPLNVRATPELPTLRSAESKIGVVPFRTRLRIVGVGQNGDADGVQQLLNPKAP